MIDLIWNRKSNRMWLYQLYINANFSQHISLTDFAAYVSDMMKKDKLTEQYEVCI